MQGELTLRLSSSWMYITYISLLFDLFLPLCWWINKKKKYLVSLYMHVYSISSFMQKKGKEFGEFMHVYFHLCIYVLFGLCISLHIFMFIAMHKLREASMKLIFNPCIYNSMGFVIVKKGRLLAQRPITLVLMMINSCSYSLLIILCLYSFSY